MEEFLKMDNDRNWRFRLELCQQVEMLFHLLPALHLHLLLNLSLLLNLHLPLHLHQVSALVPLCSPEEVISHLAPLCLLLVNDKVAEVGWGAKLL